MPRAPTPTEHPVRCPSNLEGAVTIRVLCGLVLLGPQAPCSSAFRLYICLPLASCLPRIWHLHWFLGAPSLFQPQALCTYCLSFSFQSSLLWLANPCFFFFSPHLEGYLSSFLKYPYSVLTMHSFIHSSLSVPPLRESCRST